MSLQEAFFGETSDPLLQWWNECMVIDRNSAEYCTVIWESFRDWCERNDWRCLLMAIPHPNKLGKPLRENIPGLRYMPVIRETGNDRRKWLGIRLRNKQDYTDHERREDRIDGAQLFESLLPE